MELKTAIYEAEHKPDIIAIQKAKPKDAKVPWNRLCLKIDDYSIEGNSMNPEDPGKGMLMNLSSKHDYKLIDTKSNFTDWQAAKIGTSGSNLMFASTYLSPSSSEMEKRELNRL